MTDASDSHAQLGHGAVEFDGVTFAYAREAVFRDVRLRVAAGEMVGLLGPNGAGKSTLLKLASGVLRPQSGRVLVGQRDVRTLSRTEVATRVAVVPQDFSVQFAYTVRQLVEMGRMPHAGSWGILRASDREAVNTALKETQLSALADRVFNELSGGERQRVLVAMALAQASPVMLLDEPTAHLDIRHQVEILELLAQLNRQRRLTAVAALHDLNLAARYFTRLVLFRNGVVADGPPAAVLSAPRLSETYDVPVRVGILRGEAFLSVLPPGHDAAFGGVSNVTTADKKTTRAKAHVVAGGGSGELVMRALADSGLPFTAGALNVGDSDHVLASRLALQCVSEAPYAPMSADTLAAALTCMLAAPYTVICPAPFGPGNVALLEAAVDATQAGRMVLLVEDEADANERSEPPATQLERVRQRDFAAGRAVSAYTKLLAAGARVVAGASALVSAISADGAETAT